MKCGDCRHINKDKLKLPNAGYCLQKKDLISYERIVGNCKWFDKYKTNANFLEEELNITKNNL